MPTAHGRNVALTPHLAKFVDDLVASGTYNNASEVVRDACENCSVGNMPTSSPRSGLGSVLLSTNWIGAKVQADPPPRSWAVS